MKVNEKISKYMQNSEPLTLAVAILLKIGEKHKAAASFSLDSFLDELYNDFDSGNLKLVSPLHGFGHAEFPYQEAENITKQLFHYKLIPDYVFETPDSLFRDDEWEARYSPFDSSKTSIQNDIKSGDIADSENDKQIREVNKSAAKDICSSLERKDIKEKVRDILYQQLLINFNNESDRLLEDLGADSLDLAEIIMSAEEHFHISVPDEEAEKLKTVGQIVDYLASRLGVDINSPSSNPEKNELNLETENIVSPTPKIERPAITVELIRKYLKNKGGRATLKQIQSRFKGYAENTCDSIFALISNSTGSDVLLDVSHKNVSGYTAYIYEPRQYFSAAAYGKGGLVVLDRDRNPVKPRE